MPSDYRPRLSIEISEEQQERLRSLVPWGLKNPLFCAIIDGLIPLLEEHGMTLIGVIVEKKISLSDLLFSMEASHEARKEEDV